jgi:hypothetical protein
MLNLRLMLRGAQTHDHAFTRQEKDTAAKPMKIQETHVGNNQRAEKDLRCPQWSMARRVLVMDLQPSITCQHSRFKRRLVRESARRQMPHRWARFVQATPPRSHSTTVRLVLLA